MAMGRQAACVDGLLGILNKQEAIELIKDIRGGHFDRNDVEIFPVGPHKCSFRDYICGEIAKDLWNDPIFGIGMEYGAIWGLMKAFGVTAKDLEGAGTVIDEIGSISASGED